MREPPPRKLVDLLQRLHLASEAQWQHAASRVQHLARELPVFESVWIDALAQARVLTPYQAQEINAGRGEMLRAGNYLILEPVAWPMFAGGFRAREIASAQIVWLTVFERPSGAGSEILGALEVLAAKAAQLPRDRVLPVRWVGGDGNRRLAVSDWIDGSMAAEWVMHHGRFPPQVVLEIARQMVVTLADLDRAGLPHGDVSPHGILLGAQGSVVLLHPGLRAAMCPGEAYAQPRFRPEAYDYLAPERILHGGSPTRASDLYACGCAWWHLLAGRPPLGGGDSRGKIIAAQAARIPGVERLAPETPSELTAAIAACLQPDPRQRPESIARLSAMLGMPTQPGKAALAACLARPERSLVQLLDASVRRPRRTSMAPFWMVVATCLAVAVASIFGPALRGAARSTTKETAHVVEDAKKTDTVSTAPPKKTFRDPPRLPSAGELAASAANELILPAGEPIAGERLTLRPGMRVRAADGQRVKIVVPPGGLLIAGDGIGFENVDFVTGGPSADSTESAALLLVKAAHVSFRGCLFSAAGGDVLPVAVRWITSDASPAGTTLPSGRLQWTDCVVRQVSAALDCRTAGAVGLEWNNVLFLGGGPLVRLDHFPDADEPFVLSLARVTARNSGPLVECRVGRAERTAGSIAIRANQCVWAIDPGSPLLVFEAAEEPQPLLASVSWSGQGSLLAPAATVVGWRDAARQIHPLNDARMTIAGLVRSEVEFAGSAGPDPGGSQAVRWQVPLRSPDPPGVNSDTLPGATATVSPSRG